MADISHGRADVISVRVNLRTVRIGFDFKGNDLRPEQAAQGQYVVSNNLFPTLHDCNLNFEGVGYWLQKGIKPCRTHQVAKALYGQQFTLPDCFLSFFGKN